MYVHIDLTLSVAYQEAYVSFLWRSGIRMSCYIGTTPDTPTHSRK